MVDVALSNRRTIYSLVYVGLALALMIFHLLPVSVGFGWPGPDLLVAITFAWVLRRPRSVPVVLVAAVFLFADILFMRPPGLWAALMVLSVEFLRLRERNMRERQFPVEWASMAVTLLLAVVAYRIILLVALIEPPALALTFVQYVMTVLCYPLVILASRYLFGITKMTPNDTDAMGRPR